MDNANEDNISRQTRRAALSRKPGGRKSESSGGVGVQLKGPSVRSMESQRKGRRSARETPQIGERLSLSLSLVHTSSLFRSRIIIVDMKDTYRCFQSVPSQFFVRDRSTSSQCRAYFRCFRHRQRPYADWVVRTCSSVGRTAAMTPSSQLSSQLLRLLVLTRTRPPKSSTQVCGPRQLEAVPCTTCTTSWCGSSPLMSS